MRKTDFRLCENKGADQLCSKCTANQRLCFGFTDSTIPLLPKSEISSFWPSPVGAQASLCQTCVETLKTVFLEPRLRTLAVSVGLAQKTLIQVGLFMTFEPHHEKANNVVSEQVRHKPSCTNTEDFAIDWKFRI